MDDRTRLENTVKRVGAALDRAVKEIGGLLEIDQTAIDKSFAYLQSLVIDAHQRASFSRKMKGFSLDMELPAHTPPPVLARPSVPLDEPVVPERIAGQRKKPSTPPADDIDFIDD